VNIIIQKKLSTLFLFVIFFSLTGCSVVDSYRVPSRPAVVNIPKIPEIKRQKTVKPPYKAPKRVVKQAPAKPTAQIKSSSYQIKNRPVQTPKPIKPVMTQQQKIEQQKRLQEQRIQKSTVNIDPYATIPDNANTKSVVTTVAPKNTKPVSTNSSPAITSLMTAARADIAIGKSRSAISKLERGLRIEPENAQLWHMLAKAHYSNSAYLHTISIAKKSNANSDDESLIKQNWLLIKKAGERSGNATVIKEALDYMKLNP